MAQYFEIHPENPQRRLIHQAVDILKQGGVIAMDLQTFWPFRENQPSICD